MKRLLLLPLVLSVGLFAAACGNDAPTAPSGQTAKFTATLLPANEVPAIVGPEAAGQGSVTITVNLNKDSSGYVTSATADFLVSATGFPNGTTLTGAHIHSGVAGTNGGILVSLGLSAGEVTFANGSGSFTKNGITVPIDVANSIIANPGTFYFNIPTAANSGGVARGQLVAGQ